MIVYSNRRYLSSKKTVDDQALNKNVFERLRTELSSAKTPVQILELGGGLGTMVARLVDWGLLETADYRLLDIDAELLADSRDWLDAWATQKGYTVERTSDALRFRAGALDVTVRFVRTEVGEYLDREASALDADLLIANAFLDLFDVSVMLPRLLGLVAPSGLFWFSINYDGETIFQPGDSYDAVFMQVYNRSMDERVSHGRPAGDSKTGRHLFGHLVRAGASVLVAGASDWVVHAPGGRYQADEEYFLHHIINTIDEALKRQAGIDSQDLARWVTLRHDQARRGELVYIAHQLDFVGRCDARSEP